MSKLVRVRVPARYSLSMARSAIDDDELLAVRVAELYYDEDKTQDEIGGLLGVSRWKVGRLLQQARVEGIVRIEIVHPRARKLGIERELRSRFGLADAVVVPNGGYATRRRWAASRRARPIISPRSVRFRRRSP